MDVIGYGEMNTDTSEKSYCQVNIDLTNDPRFFSGIHNFRNFMVIPAEKIATFGYRTGEL